MLKEGYDLLAFLAEEMIRLNKEKRAAMKEFFGLAGNDAQDIAG